MAKILMFHDTDVSSKPSRREMWRQFCDNRSLRQTHEITDHEMAMLERTALLGEFNSTEDLLFILNGIRGEHTADDARIRRNG
jgi:hypothetical protein